MTRWLLGMLAAGLSVAAAWPEQKQQPPPQEEQAPPEEDEGLKPKTYSFNPLQAQKEIQIGSYYWKKGRFKAAAGRFREATHWNQTNAEAWLRLAEAEEKLKDAKAAREAYEKYVALAPDAKNADAIRKKLARK